MLKTVTQNDKTKESEKTKSEVKKSSEKFFF